MIPQMIPPSARPPWKTRRYAPSARARTHVGTVFWAAVLKLAMSMIQATPPATITVERTAKLDSSADAAATSANINVAATRT